MTILLTPEIEQLIDEQVKSGRYQSASEVVLEGLRLLSVRDQIDKRRFAELKQEIAMGIEAADRGELVDSETVFRELREKNRLRRIHPINAEGTACCGIR
ncbi:MAG: type II toxin-antitoxin system ParD family antitoxin [Hormoscilla sp. GM102CHS1]|nr:type II toxin-antitoxin system ParD family antitoxin [Hormoscilla sp. GM102CHS1]